MRWTPRCRSTTALALTLALLGTAPTTAAALPGRVDAADLMRLAAGARGVLDAAGPAFDAAIGRWGSPFGAPTCDAEGFSGRPVLAPQVALPVVIPESARRVEMILRPAYALRELTAKLDGRMLGTVALTEGWQRVVFELAPTDAGPRRLRLELSNAPPVLVEAEGADANTRAVLHTIRFNRLAEPPPADAPVRPLATADTLWLEPGQLIDIPAPLGPDHALETRATRVLGDPSDVTVRLELVSHLGAADSRLELPAALQIPWNADISRGNERAPVAIRLSVVGTGHATVGLVAPRITAPRVPARPGPEPPAPERIALVVVGDWTAADAVTGGGPLPGMASAPNAWTTSPRLRPALTSLLTGRYPEAHGVRGRQDKLQRGIETLAAAAAAAGWRTAARTGYLPVPAADPLWTGVQDVAIAGKEAHRPQAEHVLDATLAAMTGRDRTLAIAVLTDIAPPYLPRPGDAWRAFLPKGTEPAWDLRKTRTILDAVARGQRTLTEPEAAFLSALRQGKAAEVRRAIERFVGAVQAQGQPPTRVVVVGLGRELGPNGVPTAPDLRVPLWVSGGVSWTQEALDLTDVGPTLAAWAGAERWEGAQGTAVGSNHPAAWSDVAFVSWNDRSDLTVMGRHALFTGRGATPPPPRLLQRSLAGGWRAIDDLSGADSLRVALMDGLRRARLTQGARWDAATGDPASGRAATDGHADACAR